MLIINSSANAKAEAEHRNGIQQKLMQKNFIQLKVKRL